MKRKLSLILAGIMALSLFTGCKEKLEETPTLRWVVPGDQQADIQEVMDKANEILVDKIGARVQIDFIDAAAYTEKMNMYMASEEDYDLCFTGYVNPYAKAALGGGLMKLDELLESTPKLKESVADYYWDIATVDGSIYAVPNQQILASQLAVVVQKDLADKYGLDVEAVTATEDLEEFFGKVRDNEKGIYPFRSNYGTASFLNSEVQDKPFKFGLASGAAISELDGKIEVETAYNEETLNSAKKLHDWFKKGYIRSDIASVVDDTQDFNAGKYAAWITTYKPGLEADLSQSMGFDVYVIPLGQKYVNPMGGRDTMIGIGGNCKYPEKAIKLIEEMNTNVELYNLIAFGIEGKHYERVDENHIKLIDESGYAPKAAWKFGNQFNAYLLEGQADDVWEETKKMNDEAYKTVLVGFTFDTKNVRTQISQIETVIGEYKIIKTGAKDPNTYYSEFVGKLEKAGVEDVRAELERQVNEFLANK